MKRMLFIRMPFFCNLINYMCVWSITPNFNAVSEIKYKFNQHFLFKYFLALSKIPKPFEIFDFI